MLFDSYLHIVSYIFINCITNANYEEKRVSLIISIILPLLS